MIEQDTPAAEATGLLAGSSCTEFAGLLVAVGVLLLPVPVLARLRELLLPGTSCSRAT